MVRNLNKKKYAAVFDSPSVIGFFANYGWLQRADSIRLYKISDSRLARCRALMLRFLVACFLRRPLKEEVVKDFHSYFVNPDVVSIIDANKHNISAALLEEICRLLGCAKEDAIKYVNKSLVTPLAKKLFISRQLQPEADDQTNLIVTDRNIYGVYDQNGRIYECGFWGGGIFRLLAVWVAAIMVLVLMLKRFRLTWKRKIKVTSDLLVQVDNFRYHDEIHKEYNPLSYVFDKEKVMLLITQFWRPKDPNQLVAYKDYLYKQGIRYLDVENFTVEIGEFICLVSQTFKQAHSFSQTVVNRSDFKLLIGLFFSYLYEMMCLRNYGCRAILGFDDYSNSSNIRTAVCRQNGILSMGVQHVAGNGLNTTPQLAYVSFDKYFIFGSFYKELFAEYWDDIDIVELSYNRIDNVLRESKKNEPRIQSFYPMCEKDNKKSILITLPSLFNFKEFLETFSNATGMLEFLRTLDYSILNMANIYVRPKHLYPVSLGVYELIKYIGRREINFILDTKCATVDLLVHADLVVASNGSGIIAECSLLKKKVITYDYFGFIRRNWTKFGSDMCLSTQFELQRTIGGFVSDQDIDVDWEVLWQAMVYPNDGDTNQIIKRTMEQYFFKMEM